MTAVTAQAAAIALAPQFRFHESEQFFPCDPEWYLGRSSLTSGKGDLTWSGWPAPSGPIAPTSSMTVLNPGPLTGQSLAAASSSTDFGHGDDSVTDNYALWPMAATTGAEPTYNQKLGGLYFSDYQRETLAGQLAGQMSDPAGPSVPCFAHITTLPTYTLLSYYFFCAYNGAMGITTGVTSPPLQTWTDGGGFFQHVADWMRLGARVVLEDDGTITLLGVEFDAHGFTNLQVGGAFTFSHQSLSAVLPLVAYSAVRSHELYATTGFHPTPEAGVFAPDYTSDGGIHWSTTPHLVIIDDSGAGNSEDARPDWLGYNGRWGSNLHYDMLLLGVKPIAEVLTTGSVGPAFKSDWIRDQQRYSTTSDVLRFLGDKAGVNWTQQANYASPEEGLNPTAASLPNGQEVLAFENNGSPYTVKGDGGHDNGYSAEADVAFMNKFNVSQMVSLYQMQSATDPNGVLFLAGKGNNGATCLVSTPGAASWTDQGTTIAPGPVLAAAYNIGAGAQVLTQATGLFVGGRGFDLMAVSRDLNGNWSAPLNVFDQLAMPDEAYNVAAAGAAASGDTSLEVMYISSNGYSRVWYLPSAKPGSWTTTPEDVGSKLGLPAQDDPSRPNLHALQVVAVSPAGGGAGSVLGLFVLVREDTTVQSPYPPSVYSLVASNRSADGTWSPPVNIEVPLPRNTPFGVAACRLTDCTVSVRVFRDG